MSILFGRNQLPVLISFVICGIVCGIFYDILKIKRRIFTDKYIFLFFDDLLFCMFSTIVFIFNAYSFNDGNIKWYEFPCMAFGFGVYRKTLSVIFIGVCFWLIDKTKELLLAMFVPVVKATYRTKKYLILKNYTFKSLRKYSGWKFVKGRKML